MVLTPATQSASSKAPVRANNPAGDAAPLFYARNGDVFMTPGMFLTREDEQRMLHHWRTAEGCDEISRIIRQDMADQLEAAMEEAEDQIQQRKTA